MATIYLSSVDGNNSDDGSTWALAKATLAAALTAAGAGGTVYADSAHTENASASITLASPGTSAAPVRVLSVDRTGNPEPPTALLAGAVVGTASGGARPIGFSGSCYVYGFTFRGGDSGGSNGSPLNFDDTADWVWIIDTGKLQIGSTSPTAFINVGGVTSTQASRLILLNTDVEFGDVGQGFMPIAPIEWKGGAVVGATLPTNLFRAAARTARADLIGVDLSALGSGKTLFDVSAANPIYNLLNCKLGSSVSLTTGTIPGQAASVVRMVNSDSADTNYRYQLTNYAGTITQETTIVKDSTLSTDGTTPLTWKMVSTANTKFYSPLESDWMLVWCDSTGSKTATVSLVTDNVTLTDAECWIEVMYLGTSGFPLALFANDRATSILATPANQTTESPTWTTTGLTTPVKQKVNATFTVEEKGPIWVRVCLAKASTTVYVDAAPVIS